MARNWEWRLLTKKVFAICLFFRIILFRLGQRAPVARLGLLYGEKRRCLYNGAVSIFGPQTRRVCRLVGRGIG